MNTINNSSFSFADYFGDSPVHNCAEEGHVDTMRLLLERKPDLTQRNGLGSTPLHLAAMKGHLKMVTLLLESPQSYKPTPEAPYPPPTAEEIAVVKYPSELPKAVLVDKQTNNRYTPLHLAIVGEHIEVVGKLLEYTLNPNIQNTRMETALHIAVQRGNLEIVRLITRKIDQRNQTAGQRNMNEWTPLQLACRHNLPTIVQLILPFSESPIIPGDLGPACAYKIAKSRRHTECARVIEDFLNDKGIEVPTYGHFQDLEQLE